MDDIGDNYMVQSVLYMGVANAAKSGLGDSIKVRKVGSKNRVTSHMYRMRHCLRCPSSLCGL